MVSLRDNTSYCSLEASTNLLDMFIAARAVFMHSAAKAFGLPMDVTPLAFVMRPSR